MLKLYYSKGSSALAAHILLEEADLPYEVQEISIPDKQHQTAGFLNINPKGRLPVLETPDGVLTESPAILEYIATLDRSERMTPVGAFAQAQARSLCAYISSTTHVAFAHKQRGIRWAATQQAHDDMKQMVPKNLAESAAYLDAQFKDGPWILGEHYSFCDPYIFLVSRWMSATSLDLTPYQNLEAHRVAMRDRPATQRVLKAHGLD